MARAPTIDTTDSASCAPPLRPAPEPHAPRVGWRSPACWALLPVLACVGAAVLVPEYRALIWVALYTIPSHILATPLPQEPGIVYGATLYTPLTVAVTVTVGALVSAWIDYRLLTPVLRGDAARRLSTRLSPRFSSFRRLRRLIAAGARQSFISHVLVHLLPVPSAPSKLLAIASGYPLRRYQAALVVGRAPRYYLLAWLGAVIAPPPWALALLLPALVGTRLLRPGARAPDSTER